MFTITAAVSRAGGRSRNEDDLRWADADGAASYWVLADGLGGHAAGDVAAQLVVSAASQALGGTEAAAASIADDGIVRRIERAFSQAQQALEQGIREAPDHAGMRATLVVAVRSGDRIGWGHVGDSRLYCFSGLKLRVMTRDHSVSAMVSPPPADVRSHESRNRLLRVLGEAAAGAPELAAPIQLSAGDALLLCSDGWWDHVLETEMELDLAAAETPQQWLERMEDRLLDRVDGDFDNYTAIAVWCVEPDPAEVGA
ncbi:MAG: PP2C family serine/threonine-protein phosphatase [Burkholderiaceae bacterium]